VVGAGAAVHVVYQGLDYKHRRAGWLGGFDPVAEPVSAGTPSFGPSPASAAVASGALVIAFAGDDHDVYDQARGEDGWAPAHAHGLGDATLVTPAIAALDAGPELVVAWSRKADGQVLARTRSAGAWSTAAEVSGAVSALPVALAPARGGGAVLAFHGTDGGLYAARLASGAAPTWSAPVRVGAGLLPAGSTPALARGVDGAAIELAWIDAATGAAQHARLVGDSIGAPEPIGGSGLTRITIASAGGTP
jgi:hypothetical protein